MALNLVIDGGQLKRLMRICRMLCAPKGATLQTLQSKLKTSRRTIFRDLNSIEKLGVKVDLGDKSYTVRHSATHCRKLLTDVHITTVKKFLNTCLK